MWRHISKHFLLWIEFLKLISGSLETIMAYRWTNFSLGEWAEELTGWRRVCRNEQGRLHLAYVAQAELPCLVPVPLCPKGPLLLQSLFSSLWNINSYVNSSGCFQEECSLSLEDNSDFSFGTNAMQTILYGAIRGWGSTLSGIL